MGNRTRTSDLAKFLAEGRADAAIQAEALLVVDAWNLRLAERRPVFFSPTLAAALISERPWLAVECGGCHQTAAIDCRRLLHSPDRAISSFLPLLTCGRCGRGTKVRLCGLSRFRP